MRKICMLALAVLLFSSCDNYLEVKTYGKAIPKSSEEFASILHKHLNSIDNGEDHVLIENASALVAIESITDNFNATLTQPGGSTLQMYIGGQLSNKQTRYQKLYEVIRDANIIINNLPSVQSAEEKNVMGTAYTMRAIAYFFLLRDFCEPFADDTQLGVPIVVDFDMEERPIRASYGAVKSLIESDFDKALSYDISDEIYRYTEDVIKAYYAKYYFWTKQWQKAIDLSAEIVDRHPLVKGLEYASMIQSQNNKEANVLLRSYLFSFSTSAEFINSQAVIKNRPLSKDFVEAFTEKGNDVRYAITTNSKRVNQKLFVGKVRSAEFVLVLAEANAHLGNTDEALKWLNILRQNRITNFQPYTLATLPTETSSGNIKVDVNGKPLTPLITAILNERRKELHGEGDRFYELKRNGRPEFWVANNGLKYTTKKYMYTFPLPRRDVELTPGLIQNEGYEF
ncbi:RagB/SusD family nutrient uptake outer membrane protein [Sphingobacterium litopenaei]|uniref:RagB/SusD family nutrient uptake outer membrane protein n=1 Tax=Sphingobacterium litopenaei TaxID=2763500 RepID=A0ABR7YDJ4_9SPHI|nr:RagB/SusD family nutrient uptake outer membrane protein [Sphingobacterium litopenaei]MBD1429367.1 RagB/SusD family nutrient uptake outer membrane protein [Sphingobacterium litopenaei]